MQTIGKYQVQRVLGRGGMGTVYEALDPIIHRKVAVKTMIPGLAESPDLRVRFLREAQAAGGLRHRNIVTVYDLGEDRGQPYIAMEFIDGTDLEKVIQTREPRPLEWKLEVLRQICDGLAYAHRAGIVHRDIKPANIRVTPEGEVKIMDFGIAHLQSSTMTKSGLVLGTVHYMAPEQIEGHKVDHRADIFSVGAIAFELLTYRKPFEGDSITAVMFKIMHERPDPSAFPRSEYSPGLDSIVMKALARDPAARYQALDEMHTQLQDLVREVKPKARRAEPEPPGAARERESTELRAQMERARAEGQLQKAQSLAQRLVRLGPGNEEAARAAAEIQTAILDGEVAQLCGLALAYAAEGDTELAQKIAGKIGRLAPQSPRYRDLTSYLAEESARKAAQELTATAQEQLAEGDLESAHRTAERALAAYPAHAVAREIRDRSAQVLATRKRATDEVAASALAPAAVDPTPATPSIASPPPPQPAAAPVPDTPAPAAVETAVLTPLPEGPPQNQQAALLLEGARRHLKERSPQKALALLEQAAALEPTHPAIQRLLEQTRVDARRAEVGSLTTSALNHFVQNNYPKARKAVEKALALEPENKKAMELLKILGSLS